jgi:energy-coupling factor transport system ATP-binding protein
MGHIILKNLGFRFEGRRQNSLEEISLKVEPGETLLVAGRSGSGKSTLLHCLSGLIPEYHQGTLHGCIRVGSKTTSWRQIPMWQKAAIAGTVFQDPRHQFFSARVEQEVLLSLWQNDSSPADKQGLTERLLDEVGMAGFGQRLLDSLSSGEQQRVAIATALAARPGILLLDEPSANLSGDGIMGLRAFLNQAKQAETTIIIAEHRFSWLEGLIDSLLVLDRGCISYHGNPDRLNDADFCRNLGLRRHTPETARHGRKQREQTAAGESHGNNAACIVNRVGFRYKKQTTWIFQNLSTVFYRARVTALTGRNGCGKTTLLGLLYGLHAPLDGTIDFSSDRPPMALVLQHPDLQLFASTVRDELRLACKAGDEWLERFGLLPLGERHPLTLSGGEMQRLILAIGFAATSAGNGGMLLLDEPTSGMDGYHLAVLCREIMKFRDQDGCVIMATHDADLVDGTEAVALEISKA